MELNLHNEYIKIDKFVIPFYKEYYGRNVEQMPKLIDDNRVPMSVAGLMQRRLDVRNSDADVKGFLIWIIISILMLFYIIQMAE